MQIRSVGIDLGKTTFHLVALGASGKVLVKKKFLQKRLLAFTANMRTSLIGLKACSRAHFLGRALTTTIWMSRSKQATRIRMPDLRGAAQQ
jgi:hypothetical protein